MGTALTFDAILDLVRQLKPTEKLRLIEAVVPDLEEPVRQAEGRPTPLRSLYGLWKDLGVSLSTEDIDQARREMWGTFPRDDV